MGEPQKHYAKNPDALHLYKIARKSKSTETERD